MLLLRDLARPVQLPVVGQLEEQPLATNTEPISANNKEPQSTTPEVPRLTPAEPEEAAKAMQLSRAGSQETKEPMLQPAATAENGARFKKTEPSRLHPQPTCRVLFWSGITGHVNG